MTNEKKLGYKLNITARTLTITKEFEEAIAKGDHSECEIYDRLINQIPGLTVVRKTHATPRKYNNKKTGRKTSRNQFYKLTYKNMEAFMNSIPNNEGYLAEYHFGRNSASKFQINAYTLIREWFMAQFPEYYTNPFSYLKEQPTLIKIEDVQKQIAEEKQASVEKKAS